MRYVYVVRYTPSGLWVCSRDNKNKIKLSGFGSCKIYTNKPDINEWFKARYPITIVDYQQPNLTLHSHFNVESIPLIVSKKEVLKPYFFFTYCFITYLFKLPMIIGIGIHTGVLRLITIVKNKIEELSKRFRDEDDDLIFHHNNPNGTYEEWLRRHGDR